MNANPDTPTGVSRVEREGSRDLVRVPRGNVLFELDEDVMIELYLGTKDCEPLLVIPGVEAPQAGADYLFVQPSLVLSSRGRRGWLPAGGVHPNVVCLGWEEASPFEFRPEVVSAQHLHHAVGPGWVDVNDESERGTWYRPVPGLKVKRG